MVKSELHATIWLGSLLVLLAGAGPAGATMLAIGDSITDRKYPAQLAALLDVSINDAAYRSARTNGDRLWDMQKQWARNKAGRYSHVLILGGINDFFQSVAPAPGMTRAETTTANLLSFVDESLEVGMRPVLMTIMPSGSHQAWNETIQEEVETTNAALRARAEFGDVTLVDMYELMGDPNEPTKLAAIYDKGDGIHPNPLGVTRMAELLADAIFAEFRRYSDLNGDSVVDEADRQLLLFQYGMTSDFGASVRKPRAVSGLLMDEIWAELARRSDINGDKIVGDGDLSLLLSERGRRGVGRQGDIDHDGVVGETDLKVVLSNFGVEVNRPLEAPDWFSDIRSPEPVLRSDVNEDLFIDGSDLNLLLSEYGSAGTELPGDIDHDGVVGEADMATLLWNYGSHVRPPQPVPGLLDDAIWFALVRRSDLNGDSIVDENDLNLLVSEYGGGEAGLAGDIDGDGTVGESDLKIMLFSFGADVGHPETFPAWPGDATSYALIRNSDASGDSIVDESDLNLLLFGSADAEIGGFGDIDNDGVVGQRDLEILLANLGAHLGQPLAVAEPRGGILAVIGAMGLLIWALRRGWALSNSPG